MIERRFGNDGAAKASSLLLFYMDTPGEIVHLLSHSLAFLPTSSLSLSLSLLKDQSGINPYAHISTIMSHAQMAL